MEFSDIPQVVAIDQQSFSMPWPESSYAYELGESIAIWLCWRVRIQPMQRVKQLIQVSGQWTCPPDQGAHYGHGGLWKIMDEAHINIAVHPDWRGTGI
jgi:ribosomal protein S18 acetylase RimI-like enzyme